MHTTLPFGKRDKQLRQQALMDAANAVFAERGFDCATTREIAERAGCAEGLIHRYFAGKHGLLMAILRQKSETVSDEFAARLPECDSLAEEIAQLLHHYVDVYEEKRDFMRVVVSQAAIDPEIGCTIGESVVRRQQQVVAARLRCHAEAGRIRPGVDIESVAYNITGLGFSIGFMQRIAFGFPAETAHRHAEQAARAFARGISNAPAEKEAP